MTHIFCVAHQPIQTPIPPDATVIWNGSAPVPDGLPNPVIRLNDASEYLDCWYTFLAGSAGTFAIAEQVQKLRATTSIDKIVVLQYRKFVSKIGIGKTAPNYAAMRLPSLAEVQQAAPDFVAESLQNDYVLPMPISLGNLCTHYAHHHCIGDLLRYTAIAADLGILGHQQVTDFLNYPYLIPGGIELGTFPADVYVDIISKLRQVCERFLQTHRPVSTDPYQRRALSFCNERLGSYLLVNHLHQTYNAIPEQFFGFIHNITDGAHYERAQP